ncbi:MAG: DeoR/GlpR transcriptional regulator [Anaerolineales bacterium]|nr:MAG: DeoR/GlpR transcriptional regulator [Anaerolineales bacterium]
MLKNERHKFIQELLQKHGVVRVTELAQSINVDAVTIRRDLSELEQKGKLHRVHGGAVIQELPNESSESGNPERRIAEAAAKFIPDGSVLFLGPGTLTTAIIPFLQQHEHLTIVTNALDAAWGLSHPLKHTLHIIGGQVDKDHGIYGDIDALRSMRVDWMILEVEGLDAEKGLTDGHRGYAAIARELFKLGAQTIIVIPPSRIGRTGALFIAPSSEVDIVITGREAPNPPLWDLSELGIRIVLT